MDSVIMKHPVIDGHFVMYGLSDIIWLNREMPNASPTLLFRGGLLPHVLGHLLLEYELGYIKLHFATTKFFAVHFLNNLRHTLTLRKIVTC